MGFLPLVEQIQAWFSWTDLSAATLLSLVWEGDHSAGLAGAGGAGT